MKSLAFLIFFLNISMHHLAAQSKDEKKVTTAVERLRLAMIDADKNELENLTSEHLSYGHSGGHAEDKATFIAQLISGKSDFVSIKLSDITVTFSKKIAIVRHRLTAIVNEDNTNKEVDLLVLLIWQKEQGQWKLLARQAVKKL